VGAPADINSRFTRRDAVTGRWQLEEKIALDRLQTASPILWISLSFLVIIADYLTGQKIHFPIAFAVPVVAASWYRGLRWGIILAVALPAARIGFDSIWEPRPDWLVIAVNYVIRVSVLAGLSYLVQHVAALTREVKVLRGILPICSSCKRIRIDNGSWKQVEAYIAQHSEAEFTHGLCEECAEKLYPQYLRGASVLKREKGR
jgi:hypothetical protein